VERSRRTGPHALHVQIADELRAELAAGRLKPGVRLPSERELAEQFAVSRATIVSALNLLRAEGLLESRRGAGSWIRACP
jgi:DNA-binding GntR family transcriptional regulator